METADQCQNAVLLWSPYSLSLLATHIKIKDMSDSQILTCYTTIGSEKEAHELINKLLNSKLIACGVTWPATSFFEWKGKVDNEEEYIIYCKTSLQVKDRFKKEIDRQHPYDVPCLLFSEVETNASYFKWVQEQTGN